MAPMLAHGSGEILLVEFARNAVLMVAATSLIAAVSLLRKNPSPRRRAFTIALALLGIVFLAVSYWLNSQLDRT